MACSASWTLSMNHDLRVYRGGRCQRARGRHRRSAWLDNHEGMPCLYSGRCGMNWAAQACRLLVPKRGGGCTVHDAGL
jgi:hypothetical protein